jgi:hypothetical protein
MIEERRTVLSCRCAHRRTCPLAQNKVLSFIAQHPTSVRIDQEQQCRQWEDDIRGMWEDSRSKMRSRWTFVVSKRAAEERMVGGLNLDVTWTVRNARSRLFR